MELANQTVEQSGLFLYYIATSYLLTVQSSIDPTYTLGSIKANHTASEAYHSNDIGRGAIGQHYIKTCSEAQLVTCNTSNSIEG